MPAGSPAVIAMTGLDTIPLSPNPAGSELQQQPVRHDLRTRVTLERAERAIDGFVRVKAPIGIEAGRQGLELRLEIGVRKRPAIRAAGDDADIAQQRAERTKADGKLAALLGGRPLAACQIAREVDTTRRVI